MKKTLLLIVVIFTAIILFGCGKPTSNTIEESINNNNFSKVVKDYESLDTDEKSKSNEIIQTKIKSIIDDFKKSEKSETDKSKSIESLNALAKISYTKSPADDGIKTINDIYTSNESFKKADAFMKSKDYASALNQYKNVVIDDSANYESAQNKLKEIAKELEKSNSIKILDATIEEQDPQFKSLYPDMICISLVNNTKETIKNMELGFLAYDKNGYPLKIETSFSLSDADYLLSAKADNVNIIPGGKFGKGSGWKLDENHGISKVIGCVKSAEFYSGETWNNPYYDVWVSTYKEKPLNK